MADAVRVGLDRLVPDALGSETLQERVEPNDGEGDPTRARPGADGDNRSGRPEALLVRAPG